MRKIVLFVMTGVLGIALALGLTVTVGSPAAQAANRMEIHKIYYNPPGRDVRANWAYNREWIQLHNRSGSRITLTGWTVRDAQGHTYTFRTYTIKAYGYVRIHTGKGTNTQTDRYWGLGNYVWNNTGDTATLKNRSGTVIDRCSYNGSGVYKVC